MKWTAVVENIRSFFIILLFFCCHWYIPTSLISKFLFFYYVSVIDTFQPPWTEVVENIRSSCILVFFYNSSSAIDTFQPPWSRSFVLLLCSGHRYISTSLITTLITIVNRYRKLEIYLFYTMLLCQRGSNASSTGIEN